jgi:hypothetical protein
VVADEANHEELGVKLVVGAVGVIAVQVLLIWGYLLVNGSDPIILNPDRRLDENGPTVLIACGPGNDREITKTVEGGQFGMWTPGRVVRGDCDIWYHHKVGYQLEND